MRSVVNVFAALALSGSVFFAPGASAQAIKQPDPYGCGPAAAANCVQGGLPYYQGVCKKLPDPTVVSTPRDDWNNGSGGVSRWELCAALKAYDPASDWTLISTGTLQDLKDICKDGGKGVVLIPGTPEKPGHFVTACSVEGNKKPDVLVIDPADGKRKHKQLSPPYVIIYPKNGG